MSAETEPTFRLSCVACGANAGKVSTRGGSSHWRDGTRATHADGAGGVVCIPCRDRNQIQTSLLDLIEPA